MVMPVVWTIAGSDPSSGAGVQADLATFMNLNVHGCQVITLITAQNSQAMHSIHYCQPELVASQMESLQHELPPKAIKLGALGSVDVVNRIADYLESFDGMVVCDPVIKATVGGELLQVEAHDVLVKRIFPLVDLLTPNLAEAEVLSGVKIKTSEDIVEAAKALLKLGVKSVLIKGFRYDGNISADYYQDLHEAYWIQNTAHYERDVHGTGCVLSAAITAAVAHGFSLSDALIIARMYLSQAVRYAFQPSRKAWFLSHKGWSGEFEDLPWISDKLQPRMSRFPSCGTEPLGFYPIVDSFDWVERLANQGVTTIQLRIKDATEDEVEDVIKKSCYFAQQNKIRLFINDYWSLAIQYQAYGVHLGQEDLKSADLNAIKDSGLRLGISTHCFSEVARAHCYQPSYMAIGPIYETTSKVMPFVPQGIAKLSYWQSLLDYPLVAIGGINVDRLEEVLETGVEGVAVISAVTAAQHPERICQYFLHQIGNRNVKSSRV